MKKKSSKIADRRTPRARRSQRVRTKPSEAPETETRARVPESQPQIQQSADRLEGMLPARGTFPIVGIGASAGGLEALEQFFKHVPQESGMAFVVIQHLDPTHKGAMVELLQRSTPMPVTEVEDRLKAEPDRVYLIPPGKDMSIRRGVLHLLPQRSPRGLNLPIDFFFRSLAEDQQERGIAVVLSGMGSDGTLGLRAIKENAGAGFVQSPDSAKFDGMPRSAIDAGLADIVAPVDELPAKIIGYREHAPYIRQRHGETPEELARSPLERIYGLLRSQTGNDFSLYKKNTIHRRIERRMGLHQIDQIADYVRYLQESPGEIDQLFREFLIGVTSFFRDPAEWVHLKTDVMPELLASRPAGGVLRAWVPGCSTGEEAYSLAMIFKEALGNLKTPKNLTLQIFATDLDRDAIQKARQGVYPANIAADVSPERLQRFFVNEEPAYRVNDEIREMVVFAPQNIIMDPPFTKLDILSCRNLLIYLGPELQKKLIPLFHYALNSNGILFLGSAETVGSFTELFGPADCKTHIYRRLEGSYRGMDVDFPVGAVTKLAPGSDEKPRGIEPAVAATRRVEMLADQLLAKRLAPAAILTTNKGDIVYSSGRTGKYLEAPVGRPTMNIFSMAREGLRLELSRAFSAAVRENRTVTVRDVRVSTDGVTQAVDLTIHNVTEPNELRGLVMVVIADVADNPEVPRHTAATDKANRAAESSEFERELERSHDEIRTMREEMQASQEELKTTNEELQSANEELQSTNEELRTSKEEMQSMNEELQTVNQQLQSKLDELSRANNDMKNLLNSTDIATLFLDDNLCVRRFTTQMASLIKLIPADAGRPVTDIARNIDYPGLAEDAHEVLRTLVSKEKLVAATNNRWFVVRIMPYRTLENRIDGLVITFIDAGAAKAMELALLQQASELKQMFESLPDLVWACRADGACNYVTPRWLEYTGAATSDIVGDGWLDGVHPEDRDRVRTSWHKAVASGLPFRTEFRLRDRDGRYHWFRSRATPIHNAEGKVVKWYGTNADIDDLKQPADRPVGELEPVK